MQRKRRPRDEASDRATELRRKRDRVRRYADGGSQQCGVGLSRLYVISVPCFPLLSVLWLRFLPFDLYRDYETDANSHPHFTDLSLVHKQITAAVSLIHFVATHAYQTLPVQMQSGSTLSHGATVRSPW